MIATEDKDREQNRSDPYVPAHLRRRCRRPRPWPSPSPPESPAPRRRDIVDTAVAAGQFTTLARALQAAGLVDTLKGPGPFTVFAPTDAAFAKLPPDPLNALLAEPAAAARGAHLPRGAGPGHRPADVVRLQTARTVQGETIRINAAGGTVRINDATVTTADVMASNGVIHVIDTVLLPPSIVAALPRTGGATTRRGPRGPGRRRARRRRVRPPLTPEGAARRGRLRRSPPLTPWHTAVPAGPRHVRGPASFFPCAPAHLPLVGSHRAPPYPMLQGRGGVTMAAVPSTSPQEAVSPAPTGATGGDVGIQCGQIWMDGTLVPQAEAQVSVLVARPALRDERLRGPAGLRHPPRPGHLPPLGAHPAPLRLGPHHAHARPLQRGSRSTPPSWRRSGSTSGTPATCAP